MTSEKKGESPRGDTCWVVTQGHAGMENQAIGLAERIGLSFAVKRVHPRPPWTWLPPAWWPAPLASLSARSDRLAPPWPDLLITSGRRSVPFSLYIRRMSGGRTFTVHIQDPKAPVDRFDLVVPPQHDGLSGANVLPTLGALHRITPERLQREAAKFAPGIAHLPRPLAVVLIGGNSSAYRLTEPIAARLADRLARLAADQGVGLAVTPSRRTGEANIRILRRRLAEAPASVWDFTGDNPYFGYLGLADFILVTADSVTMASEALATGKPVYVIDLEGGNAKFRTFHRRLREAGYTRPFEGRLERWRYAPLDEVGGIAREIRRRLAERSGNPG